jgi:hypothetical protein
MKSKKLRETPQSVFTVCNKKQASPISASAASVLSRSPGSRILALISFPVSQWMQIALSSLPVYSGGTAWAFHPFPIFAGLWPELKTRFHFLEFNISSLWNENKYFMLPNMAYAPEYTNPYFFFMR